jgi:hypothetical protein
VANVKDIETSIRKDSLLVREQGGQFLETTLLHS